MQWLRILRHLCFMDWQTRRAFSPASLQSIGRAVQASERTHAGEIRFVVEGSLDGAPLLRGDSVRARAIDVFSHLRVWDTEHNNGVLLYVLLADRAVEIVVDRGIAQRVDAAQWADICHAMEQAFTQNRFEAGALQGIAAVATVLARHFPGQRNPANELPDAPVVLG